MKSRIKTFKHIVLSLVILFLSLGPAHAQEELVLLNWSEYMDPGVLRDFEKKYNAKVKEIFYESNGARDELLLQTEGKGYDVVVLNPLAIPVYRARGWVIPLGEEKVPNIKHIDPFWFNIRPAAKDHTVPFMTGTTGLIYRKDLVKTPIKKWEQYFKPEEALREKIFMLNSYRNVIGFALKSLGYSYNSVSKKEFAEAKKLLSAQQPYIQSYGYLTSFDQNSGIVKGSTSVAMMYNGDALKLLKHHPELVYVIPEEGALVWLDSIAVMKHSNNQKLATQFVNFIHEPKNAARQSVYAQFATPNKSAQAFMPDSHLKNPAIYPDEEALKRSEVAEKLGSRVLKRWKEFFVHLTQ